MGDANDARSQGHGRPVRLDDQAERQGAQRHGSASGFWSDAEWISCRDGKYRPVEPGVEPLVNGAPARVGRLRAYGNAIVAPVAATFIRAYMECAPC
jgi:DNA (cytosine-5)-methyltransferase 1